MSKVSRTPGYLGRILDVYGDAVGTCFQIEPGLAVTAWHVLDRLTVGEPGSIVRLDPLAGGPARDAEVVKADDRHDLAVLSLAEPLPTSVVGLAATDAQTPLTPIVITGTGDVPDPGHFYAFLTTTGIWQGGTTRDGVPLGRLRADAVLPGMSGAPVRRVGDDTVIGMVSGRYNSADGWLTGTAWIARTEDLAALLHGMTTLELAEVLNPNRVPRTPEELQALLHRRPPAWGYLLFGGVLLRDCQAVEAKWHDLRLRLAKPSGRRLDDAEAIDKLNAAIRSALAIVQGIPALIEEIAQAERDGDERLLEYLAARIVAAYDSLLDWAADLRSTVVSAELADVYEGAARLANKPIADLRAFIDRCVTEFDQLSAHHDVTVELAMGLDESLLADFQRERDRAQRRMELK